MRQKRKLRDRSKPAIDIFPYRQPPCKCFAFRQSRLLEFRQSLPQERPDVFLFKAGVEERDQGVEGEEEDRPDHAEPAGQEGSGEGGPGVGLVLKAGTLTSQLTKSSSQ